MRRVATFFVLALLMVSAAIATEQQKTDTPKVDTPKSDTPKVDRAAQQKAAMDAMARAATPGEAHKKLSAMAGTFDTKIKMWMEPGAPPAESSGKAVNEWVLGGRFLQQRFDGTVMNMPFSGIGYTGYDNVRHMYVGTWMDNMSTAFMTSSGNGPEGTGTTWSFNALGVDPMSSETVSYEEKITVVDNDHHVFEMYGPGPDGTMFKMMEISYTRKK